MLYTGTPEAHLTVLVTSRDTTGDILPHVTGDEMEEMFNMLGANVRPISVSELELIDTWLDQYRVCIHAGRVWTHTISVQSWAAITL